MAKPLKIKKVSPTDRIDKTAVRILRTRLKEYYSHWPDPDRTPTPEKLHDMRISGKRLRYSAESLRALYPDQLALLIELLKRGQDLLGDIQDCVVQRSMIADDLNRLRQRKHDSNHIPILESLISEFDQHQTQLFTQFHNIWRGMMADEFRHSLKKMFTNPDIYEAKSGDAHLHLINREKEIEN